MVCRSKNARRVTLHDMEQVATDNNQMNMVNINTISFNSKWLEMKCIGLKKFRTIDLMLELIENANKLARDEIGNGAEQFKTAKRKV